jgi:hypothetical protein
MTSRRLAAAWYRRGESLSTGLESSDALTYIDDEVELLVFGNVLAEYSYSSVVSQTAAGRVVELNINHDMVCACSRSSDVSL